MTLYYAVGGGLGHRNRARRVLTALDIDIRDADILVTSDLPAELEGNPEAHRRFLADRFKGRRVIVDVFPAGIQGELSGIEGVRFDHVARLIQWPAYRAAVPHDPPRFETTYVVEPLTPEHETFAREASERVASLALADAPSPPAVSLPTEPFSLIVHSGPADEVEELMAYARELHPGCFLVATCCQMEMPAGFERLETNRASDYFAAARHIVSAAGFNTMLETEPWREKHHVVPFPRRFDDQFLRAARRRERCSLASGRADPWILA